MYSKKNSQDYTTPYTMYLVPKRFHLGTTPNEMLDVFTYPITKIHILESIIPICVSNMFTTKCLWRIFNWKYTQQKKFLNTTWSSNNSINVEYRTLKIRVSITECPHGCTHSVKIAIPFTKLARKLTLSIQMLMTMPIGHMCNSNNDGKWLFSHHKAKCYAKRRLNGKHFATSAAAQNWMPRVIILIFFVYRHCYWTNMSSHTWQYVC